jgi:nucleoside-diphosphate-sugar epimerase
MAMPASPAPPDGQTVRRTVVIGGTGFLGRHVCAALRARSHELLVVGRNPARNAGGHPFVALDLARPEAVADLAHLFGDAAPDIVVNAAGAVWSPTERDLSRDNVDLVRHLVTAIAGLPRKPRLVHLGSVNEYSPLPWGAGVTEETPLGPVTRYGLSKVAGSSVVLQAAERAGLDALVLRLANVAGPGLPSVSLLGRVAEQLHDAARAGRAPSVRLYPMRAHRDFLDYQDAARAIVTAAVAPVSGRVINIGSGEAVSVRWLVSLLISVTGMTADVVEAEPPPASRPVPEAEWLRVDPRGAMELLGWYPRRCLRDSIRDLWEHVRGSH